MAAFDFTVRTKQDLADAVERFGIVPLFANSIPGFSVEEHAAPEAWFSGDEGVWEWKGPVIRETGCAYGKFFEKKAAFVSWSVFPDLANWRRDGYDFDARFDDGLASYADQYLFNLIDARAPVLSGTLREIGNYKKGGRKGFETVLGRLMHQCYVQIDDFVYLRDRTGKPYGWGVAQYSTPEKQLGEAFSSAVYRKPPEASHAVIFERLKALTGADDRAVQRFMK
ncbi:MAG: hypothetical protein K6A33_09785 [Clostridiales bacterium]|nr:hypothetical protein [Clostridiales bacterium]